MKTRSCRLLRLHRIPAPIPGFMPSRGPASGRKLHKSTKIIFLPDKHTLHMASFPGRQYRTHFSIIKGRITKSMANELISNQFPSHSPPQEQSISMEIPALSNGNGKQTIHLSSLTFSNLYTPYIGIHISPIQTSISISIKIHNLNSSNPFSSFLSHLITANSSHLLLLFFPQFSFSSFHNPPIKKASRNSTPGR